MNENQFARAIIAMRNGYAQIVEQLNDILKEATPEAIMPSDIPRIDPTELDDCGWQTFQKQPAKLGVAAWIRNPVYFTSWQHPPQALIELVKALKRTDNGELTIGDMKYCYGGPQDKPEQFIHRKPVKTETAK